MGFFTSPVGYFTPTLRWSCPPCSFNKAVSKYAAPCLSSTSFDVCFFTSLQAAQRTKKMNVVASFLRNYKIPTYGCQKTSPQV